MKPATPDGALPSGTLARLRPREVLRVQAAPCVPFEIELADGEPLRVTQVLRLLPGRRLVARVQRRGETQLMKLYARPRDRARELRGLGLLHASGVPAPGLLAAGAAVVFLEYLPEARTLGEALAEALDETERAALLAAALALLDRLHAAGLRHADPHLANFLVDQRGMHLVDAASVRRAGWRRDGIALFCCQLPLAERAALRRALGAARLDDVRLQRAIARADRWRAERLAEKAARSCREFAAARCWRERRVLRRDADTPALRALLADPDAAMARGTLLKDGNSATVARVCCDGRALVVKRYNIKGWRHAVWRCWRPSRAWRAWLNAARLRALGVDTPAPVAVLERRWGPLRGRAYLVSEYQHGAAIAAALGDDAAAAGVARGLRLLFAALRALGRRHGDCKASNFLFDGARLWVLDLDAMRRLPGATLVRRGLARDRARLLRSLDAGAAQRVAALLAAQPED